MLAQTSNNPVFTPRFGLSPNASRGEKSILDASLVKGSKCPTRLDVLPPEPITSSGTLARLSHRPWSDEWRITCHTATPSSPPPLHFGRRVTDYLSERGARTISTSCEFVAKTHGGFKTFLTLTFDSVARSRMQPQAAEGSFCKVQWSKIGKPKHDRKTCYLPGMVLQGTTIQQEVTRFLDGLTKMYQRGWVAPYETGKLNSIDGAEFVPINWTNRKIESDDLELCYLWVAENPLNAAGEDNPHVHVLMNWHVPRPLFHAWAYRLEQLWGQGFAKLQRLRNKEAAAYYMAKAAKYLTKARGNNGQGTIRGNRYGLNSAARAPGWQVISTWAIHLMGHLITKSRAAMEKKIAPIKADRDRYRRWLKEAPKGSQGRRIANRLLQGCRKKLRELPAYFGKLSIVCRSREIMDRFLTWCHEQGWRRWPKPYGWWFTRRQQHIKNPL